MNQEDSMSAEGMPQKEQPLLARPLGFFTRVVLRFPKTVLFIGLLLAAAAIALAVFKMGFRTSRLDLLNPNSAYNQRWLDYLDEFGNDDDAIVVVEGQRTDRIVAVTDQLAKLLLREDRYFREVMHKRDLSKLRGKGLHYLSVEQLGQLDRFLQSVAPTLKDDWRQLNILRSMQQVGRQRAGGNSSADSPAEIDANFTQLVNDLTLALGDRPRYRSPWPSAAKLTEEFKQFDSSPLLTNQGQMGLVLLKFNKSNSRLTGNGEAIDRLRQIMETVQAQHDDVRIGLTGMPVLENDEMQSSQNDMIQASLLSLLGVACLFVAGFGGLRHPLVTVTALLISMAWSLGYITIAVGHLNILSVSFGVILIGLGIDFGIHYVARYLQLLRVGKQSDSALVQTAMSVGPGIVTGGVTTAIAFASASMTEFTGVAELGMIAGGGILLCVVGALFVLPALVHLIDHRRSEHVVPSMLSIDPLLKPILRYPSPVLVLGLSFTTVVSVGMFLLRYDHNLLNLQARNLESVRLERKLTDHSDRSVWFALSMADSPEEIRRRQRIFERLECVERTEEIVSLLPASDARKDRVIAEMSRRLATLPKQVPLIPVESPQQLREMLGQIQRLSSPDTNQIASLPALQKLAAELPEAVFYQRISAYQQYLATELLKTLHILQAMSNPQSPRVADIPAALANRFIGKNQKYLLRVYARGNIWDMERLEQFVSQIEAVDPQVTGHPVQTFYASSQMLRSYIHAALYALLAVMIVLMLDFRSFRYSLLALSPMFLGMVQMFGVLGLLDIPLNPANMIVLPLILGIGIDDGVHVVHDFRRQRGRYRLSSSTATAVLITSMTTMVGFGMMMFANHQGLRSLGQVLTIGVFCCLGTSVFILPAWLAWMTRNRTEPLADEEPGNDEITEELAVVLPSSRPADSPAGDENAPQVGRQIPSDAFPAGENVGRLEDSKE